MENHENKNTKDSALPGAIVIAAVILGATWLYTLQTQKEMLQETTSTEKSHPAPELSTIESVVLPPEGSVLPVRWNDLGAKLVSVGVIDPVKFEALYKNRGTFTDEYKKLLLGKDNEQLTITEENAGYLLNLFWALGLASKNPILEKGEMTKKEYGGAHSFASTGGWKVSQGAPMGHYSRHLFFALTPEQQVLVEKMSKGIYRPCCPNATHFPDCNHGMAMLGFLQLMASQGIPEEDMWKAALTLNAYWFPDAYTTIAAYMKQKGIEWQDVNPQEILGFEYSSSSGYRKIASKVSVPTERRGGSGCGLNTEAPVAPAPKQGSGCGM